MVKIDKNFIAQFEDYNWLSNKMDSTVPRNSF